MTETIDYLGFVNVGEKTPLLVRAPKEDREVVRQRHGADDVIFTDAGDMPTLEALLEAHDVSYAYLELPPPLADDVAVAAPDLRHGWRRDARRRLLHAVDALTAGDVRFHEDYAFLPALSAVDLDAFLARAHRMLDDDTIAEGAWDQFLVDADRAVAAEDPRALDEADVAATDDDVEAPMPLLSTHDLTLTYRHGALGGPAPLASGS